MKERKLLKFPTINSDSLEQISEFSKYKNFMELGKGANGITYQAEHKFLKSKVVIKIYGIDLENKKSVRNKHKEEIKKNSKYKLTTLQSVTFDAGEVEIENRKYLYSIMNYLDAITLEDWLEMRIQNERKQNQINFNTALGFLLSCSNLRDNFYNEQITHGDLNSGNVMILKSGTSQNNTVFFDYTVANGLYLIPNYVEFIDYGTSQWERTKKETGIKRDIKFIIENTEQILKGYPINSFILKESFDYSNKNCYVVIIDLIRIIVALHFIEIISSEPSLIDKKTEDWLFRILYNNFKNEDTFEFNYLNDLSIWSKLKPPSKGEYISEQDFVNFINEKYSNRFRLVFVEKYKPFKIIIEK